MRSSLTRQLRWCAAATLVAKAALAQEGETVTASAFKEPAGKKACKVTLVIPRGLREGSYTRVSGKALLECGPASFGQRLCKELQVHTACDKLGGWRGQLCSFRIARPCDDLPGDFELIDLRKAPAAKKPCPASIDAPARSCKLIKKELECPEGTFSFGGHAQLHFAPGLLDGCEPNAEISYRGFQANYYEICGKQALVTFAPCSIVQSAAGQKLDDDCKRIAGNESGKRDLFLSEAAAQKACKADAAQLGENDKKCAVWSCPRKEENQ